MKDKTIGERILFARNKAGISQATLALAIGVTAQAIGSVERGENESKKLPDIAEALNVSYRFLKYGEDADFNSPQSNRREVSSNSATYEEIQSVIPAALDRTIVAISKRLAATGNGKVDVIKHREIIAKVLSYAVIGELSDDYSVVMKGMDLLSEING
ncbi:MAG: transcriptional regulator with XRE-family HTH domain [Alteromonadaceae bacterium]